MPPIKVHPPRRRPSVQLDLPVGDEATENEVTENEVTENEVTETAVANDETQAEVQETDVAAEVFSFGEDMHGEPVQPAEIAVLAAEAPDVVDEALLPPHVRAEREAGRQAVAAAQNRHTMELAAGQQAVADAFAREAVRNQ